MAKYFQKGEKIDFLNIRDAEIKNGEVIAIGERIAIAGMDIPAGDTGTVITEGVFFMEKAAETIGAGDKVYFDDTTKKVTKTASKKVGEETVNNPLAGWAIEAAAQADTEVLVKIN